MKGKLFRQIIFAVLIVTAISSCGKKRGCIDIAASNFCSKCNNDDGSCQYQGRIVVWWGVTKSQAWTASHVTSVIVYIDGASAGTETASNYWLGAPACGDLGSITFSKSLGTAQTMGGTVVIKNGSNGAILSTETFTYSGGLCAQLQIQ